LGLIAGCSSAAPTPTAQDQTVDGCGGHPLSCAEVVARYLDDSHEASLTAMELEQQCAPDRRDACLALAYFLIDGVDVPRQPDLAARLLGEGCNEGHAGACGRLGRMLARRDPSPDGDLQARTVLSRACNADAGDSCVELSQLAEQGRGGRADAAEALRLNRKGCELGAIRGCRRAADYYVMENDSASLRRLYRGMCERSQAEGCVRLSRMAARDGQLSAVVETAAYLERGCELGDSQACTAYGWELARGGMGVLPDSERSLNLLEAGCEHNDWQACAYLARVFDHGAGVAADPGRARSLYERACERRSGVACYELGMLHREAGSEQDLERAVELFGIACDSGDERRACGSLGAAYDLGRGVEQDRERAIELYHRACDAGHGDSCVRLANLVEARDQNSELAVTYRDHACRARAFEDLCPRRPVQHRFTGRVTSSRGRAVPAEGQSCAIVVDQVAGPTLCRVSVRCAGTEVYRSAEPEASCEFRRGELLAVDGDTSPFDGSPSLFVDTASGEARIGDATARTGVRHIVLSLGE
ncbi:MAG: tetratricopeptide repeat protein, partial [Myxococcota bacterium]